MAAEKFDSQEHPHIRFNPLRGEWMLVCPHRLKRPWTGQVDKPDEIIPQHDPKNPLCPGSTRANGKITPQYEDIYVFDNDFSALLMDCPPPEAPKHKLLCAAPAKGTCRVVCFHPRQDYTLSVMAVPEIRKVVDALANQIEDIGKTLKWVQIFENRGKIAGCSNPHPHFQIWACDFLPNIPSKMDANQKAYLKENGKPLLLDYAEIELKEKERVVIENDHWVVLVPYWAMWPYETMLLPKRHVLRFPDLTPEERDSLSSILKRLLTRYDNLFEASCPYTMGWYGAPTGDAMSDDNSHWQFHGLYSPPVLKSVTVRKYMSGFDAFSQPQRDFTPEKAAEKLRSLSEVHFKDRKQ